MGEGVDGREGEGKCPGGDWNPAGESEVVKSESFDGTLPVRRAAADIAAHGVDTRGVRGTAVVTAVVDVQLAVIALETCNKPAAATTSRSIALLPMYARTPAASRSRSAVAPRPINYGDKVQGPQGAWGQKHVLFFLYW